MININNQIELVLNNKNKFIRLIKFIKNKLFNRKDRAKYREFSKDLYEQQLKNRYHL